MEGIQPIDPSMRPIEQIMPIDNAARGMMEESSDTFQNILVQEIDKIVGLHKEAGALTMALAKGEDVDLSQVVIAVEKADLSLRFALQLRNKVLEAYQEITRMPI
ncbi:flagellar hook-basal body complex protein FliE [bacterium]|nr:flagellar hook-basal body complex protein FliE [bacterium]